MEHQALYRKWRPDSFDSVIGQDAIVTTLRNQVKNNRVSHAYLFSGTRGTGKTTLAKLMAKAANCSNSQNGNPCGECSSCTSILNGSNMDVLELDAASRNKVEDMRELLEQVNYPPQIGNYKVYIIDEVHMLSTAAFNALLKTLEEPPTHLIFILATTEPQKLPATILSRCMRFDLSRVSSKLIYERLELALKENEITYSKNALQIISNAAEGSVRDGWSILDMCIAGMSAGDKLTDEHVDNMLGTTSNKFLFEFVDAIANKQENNVLNCINKMMLSGREPLVFIKQVSKHFRLLLICNISSDNESIQEISDIDFEKFKKQSKLFTHEELLNLMDTFMKAENELKWSSSPRIGLEILSLKACQDLNLSKQNISNLSSETISLLEKRLNNLENSLKSNVLSNNNSETEQKNNTKKNSLPNKKITIKVDYKDASELWSAILKESRNNTVLYTHIRNTKLIKKDNGEYDIVYPFNRGASYNIMAKSTKLEELNTILNEHLGHSVKLGLIHEDNPKEMSMHNDAQMSIHSLMGTLPRELIEIHNE